MTFTTPPLDPSRRALLRDHLVAEVARTSLPGAVPAVEDGSPAGRRDDGAAAPGTGTTPGRRWLPVLVAAAASGIVAVGALALGGGDRPGGPAAPAAPPPQEPAGPGAVRVLSADELAALGAGRSGYGFVAECMRAEGWDAVYHPQDESVEGSLPTEAQARWDADWRLCRAAAAVGMRSTGDVTEAVWTALHEHAREVARCATEAGVPVAPLPEPEAFAEAYGSMREWMPYPGDPDLLTPAQLADLDRCSALG